MNFITWQDGHINALSRTRVLKQTPLTIWLTGLSGSGKSTLAFSLENQLLADSHACCVLDGDNMRHGLCRDLGFSHTDRTENIRRVAEVAHLMNEAGLIVVTAFISPYHADREQARTVIGADRFVEVFLNTPLAECENRDPKGLYRRARAGEIPCFTGVSDVYEAPERPTLSLDTASLTVEDSIQTILAHVTPLIRCK